MVKGSVLIQTNLLSSDENGNRIKFYKLFYLCKVLLLITLSFHIQISGGKISPQKMGEIKKKKVQFLNLEIELSEVSQRKIKHDLPYM